MPSTKTSAHDPRKIVTAIAILVLAASGRAALADDTEPFNDIPVNGPTYGRNVHAFHILHQGRGEFQSFHAIDSSTDYDHLTLFCANNVPDGPPRWVDQVWITFSHSRGDLDMGVLHTSNPSNWHGASVGTTDREEVTVSGKFGSVTLKVWGWSGATGPYTVGFSCKND